MPSQPPTSYAILLYDGVEPIDIGATFGVLSMASRRIQGLTFFGVAARTGPVRCAGNLTVNADHDFQSCTDVRNIVVTGGPGWVDAANDAACIDFLRSRAAQSPPPRISSICTGAMILAAAGLLDGKSAATKQQVFEGETAPTDLLRGNANIDVCAEAVVESGGMVTSGGVTLGIDAMFRLLALDHGQAVADDIARVMEYGRSIKSNHEALGYRTE